MIMHSNNDEKHSSANPRHNLTELYIVTFGLKISLHVLGEHNGMKTELYIEPTSKVKALFQHILH